MNTILLESHYLPSLEYFCALFPFENIVLERHENFVKQSYRNRCHINTAHGVKMLTIPLKERHGKMPMKEVQVEAGTRWRNNHWRTIETAYRKAPYYDYYSEELKNILYSGHELLFDLNTDLLSFCLQHIGLQKNISASVAYEQVDTKSSTDFRSSITNKKPVASRSVYQTKSYYQVFGNEFASNLSFIDLLFCEGPQAFELIKASCRS